MSRCLQPSAIERYPFAPEPIKAKSVEYHEYRVEAQDIHENVASKFYVLFERQLDSGLRIHIRRLDNREREIRDEHDEENRKEFYLPIDKLWHDMQGWPVPLTLKFIGGEPVGQCVTIPANPDTDCMSVTAVIKASSPKFQQHRVPKFIFQTTRKLAPYLQKSTFSFRELNPEWTYVLLEDGTDESRIHQFLIEYEIREEELEKKRSKQNQLRKPDNPTTVWDAYHVLRPGAFKADLLRLVLLYTYGGVYCDDKITLLHPLDALLPAEKSAVMVRDIGSNGILNAFMAFEPRHPFLKAAIDRILYNVNRRFYGRGPLEITGPRMLGQLYDRSPMQLKNDILMWNFVMPRIWVVQFPVGEVIKTDESDTTDLLAAQKKKAPQKLPKPFPRLIFHNAEYRRLHARPGGQGHYHTMWSSKDVYGENACERLHAQARDRLYPLLTSDAHFSNPLNPLLMIFSMLTFLLMLFGPS